MRLEELLPLVELERAGVLFLVDHVRRGAGGDHHCARRQLHDRPGVGPAAVLDDLLLEKERSDVAEFIGDRFDG